jgi:hypothetical protein
VSRDEAQQPLWQEPAITRDELGGLAEWTLAPHATLLSAVMTRIHLLWRYPDSRAELDINPLTGFPAAVVVVGTRHAEPVAAPHAIGDQDPRSST